MNLKLCSLESSGNRLIVLIALEINLVKYTGNSYRFWWIPGFFLAMKKGPQQKTSKTKMPPSSHSPSPSSLTSNMRSRSLSPLNGSETLPFHPGRQWYEQVEIIGENTMLLDYHDQKGNAFESANFAKYSSKYRWKILNLHFWSKYNMYPSYW